MNAKEARQITDSAPKRVSQSQLLFERAMRQIEHLAGNGESKLVNPFQGLRSGHSREECEGAYAMLEQQGYNVVKLGDNVIISW